jgi:hypothetical protein
VALNAKQGIVKDSWDKWTSQRDTQAQLSLSDSAVSTQGPLYGWSDLNAYGEWGFFPGFGYGWSPFVSAGWSPYSMGMWSWYPGMGYSWIGGEPWGWLPYHYGNWNFSPGFGWFWMMGNYDASWSPALVSWYSGPGWIGWAPLGAFGGAGRSIVTTVPGGTIQNGLMIGPQNVNHVPITAGSRIRSMPFQPGAGAMLSGAPLSASAEELFTPHAGGMHSMAPGSILMGGDAAKEQPLLSAHQPLRARSGATLGGHYAVGGAVGEFRGNAFSGAHGAPGPNGMQGPGFSRVANAGGPTLLPHGQQSSSSPQAGGGMAPGTGGMAPHTGGMMPSGGGGNGNAGGATPNTGGGHTASPSGGHH